MGIFQKTRTLSSVGKSFETMTHIEAYEQFKLLHPNSKEEFCPTPENYSRWCWHIRKAVPDIYKRLTMPDKAEAEEWRESRRIRSFDGFNAKTQQIYLLLADMFAGRQIWATGSRVNGDWIDLIGDNSVETKGFREVLGKADKDHSDHDFTLVPLPGESMAELRKMLPKWADLLAFNVPENEKIKVPMWDFSRLPKSEHANVLALYEAQDWRALIAVHDKYTLSHNTYCCDETPVIRWFKWAIEQGLIEAQKIGDDE